MRRALAFLPCLAATLTSACIHITVDAEYISDKHCVEDNRAGLDVTAARLRHHVEVLAHDELAGRGTGSDGIDLAAGYIAGQLAALGAEPGGPDGSYFQAFEVERGTRVGEGTRLSAGDISARRDKDFTVFGFSEEEPFEGPAAFVGYGIVNPDENHDDYHGLDVKEKVVMMLRREPARWSDGAYSDHARFDNKVALAVDRGAAAVLIVNQDPGDDGIDGLMPMRRRGNSYGLPAMHVSRTFADRLLAQGGLPNLVTLQDRLDTQGSGHSADLAGVYIKGEVVFETRTLPARNVIAKMPGNGSRKDEYIVVGAHYDHLGERNGQIYNGADDNASGTAAVIEIARALAEMPHRERSVLLMAFSGEEMGLWGSRHYVEEPTVDIESIKAMVNMDMIGRLTPDDEANMLAVHGTGTGDSFDRLVADHAAAVGLEYLPDPSALGPSDHSSFYRVGVPALFFFTGIHEDYHQPGDDIDKVNYEGTARITRMVAGITADLVNAEEAPQYVEVNTRANVFRGASPGRSSRGGVVMGIMPDMNDQTDAPGWGVARVFPGGGAEKAGMKSGDRILALDGRQIQSLSDYREVTADKKPGDTVEVTVRRGREELMLTVELQARG